MTNHIGPSGQWKYETVRVVFRTHDGDDYETIDREEWIDEDLSSCLIPMWTIRTVPTV